MLQSAGVDGCTVLIWGAFSHDGFRYLNRISGRIDSVQYQAILIVFESF